MVPPETLLDLYWLAQWDMGPKKIEPSYASCAFQNKTGGDSDSSEISIVQCQPRKLPLENEPERSPASENDGTLSMDQKNGQPDRGFVISGFCVAVYVLKKRIAEDQLASS